MSTRREGIHKRNPFRSRTGMHLLLDDALIGNARLHDTDHDQFHIANGNLVLPILEGKHLTLLGNAQMSVDRSGWLPQDCLVDGAATTPNCATTTMKERNADTMTFS